MPAAGLAYKRQLRGTGCGAGLRSDSTMQHNGAAVQLKKSMDVIHARRGTKVTSHVATAASAVSTGQSPGDSATEVAESMFLTPHRYEVAVRSLLHPMPILPR
jgi:hypothetical protein